MNIYIVYHSQAGLTHGLAKEIAEGAKERKGVHVFLRRIPDYAGEKKMLEKASNQFPIPEDGISHGDIFKDYESTQLYSADELKDADALIVGSPVYFGAMSAATKIFIESLVSLWVNGNLENKPCGAFVTSGAYHGGKEQTLQSMLSSLLAYSMIPVGLPFRAAYMHQHGSIFGPTATRNLTNENKALARLYGKRVAEIAFAMEYGLSEEKKQGNLG